jgi:hypothetical protein
MRQARPDVRRQGAGTRRRHGRRCAVNKRGQLERAISAARVGAAPYALFTQLLRRAGNDTGEIDDDKWAPKLDTLIAQAKLSRASGYRALAELDRHGWFKRYETENRAKVAGILLRGRDCDCAGAAVCRHCGGPLAQMRPHARYCSGRCRMAAHRQSQKPSQPVSETVTDEPAASLSNRDMSHMKASHVTHESVTASLSNRDNSQVTGPQTDVAHKESRSEGEGERAVPENEPVCGLCGAPVSPLRFAQTRSRGVTCGRCEGLAGGPPAAQFAASEREASR